MRVQRLLIATAMLTFGACKLWEPSVVCADGTRCPDGTTCAAGQGVCITDPCGNGVKDEGERCDDGNVQPNDGCSSDCMSEERCGDGLKEERRMEVCDDGNTMSGDGCSSDCRSDEKCGNGIPDPGEACDHGNSSDRMGCSSDCKDLCGDGMIGATEQCDPEAPVQLFCADDPNFDMGRLDCDADCEYSMDACVSFGLYEVPKVPPAMPPEQKIELNAIWSDGSGNGYGVGNKGTIVRFTREGWGKEDVPSDFTEVNFYGVWGAGSEGPVYVVGDSGAILTRSDRGWEPVEPSSALPVPGDLSRDAGPPPEAGPPPSLKGIWGYTDSGGTVAFAVGDDCTILKLASGTWTEEQVPQECDDSLQAVSGNERHINERHIYAVAQNTAEEGPSVILRHDDAIGWERLELRDVEATSHNDIWVGSDDTFILAGERIYKCEEVAPPDVDAGASAGVPSCARMDYSGGMVSGIWGSSPHDLFAVAGFTVFHSNGFLQDEWTAKFHSPKALVDIHGGSAFDIFVASEAGILHGALPWRKMDSANDDLLDVWADETTVYAAGETGLFWLDKDGAWERVGGAQGEIHDLWGIDGSHVFAVGHGFDSGENATVGRLFLCDKGQCAEQEPPPDTISPYLRGVWASNQNNVFVVGDDGAALRFDFDPDSNSGEWNVIAMAEPGDATDLYDIWGSDTENLFAVGSAGTIFRYDEGTWRREPLPLIYNEATLLAIWGASANNIFAVGQYGTILHYKGVEEGWNLMASPTLATLYDIGGIVTDGQIKLFAVGYDGLVLHYDGGAWSEVKTDTTDNFNGVWVTPTDVFMVADDGNTYRLQHSVIETPSLE